MNCRKKRKVLFFLSFMLISILISLLYKTRSDTRKESRQLNLQNIHSIEIHIISDDYETKERATITDEMAIEEFMNYFNSIELVEVDPGHFLDLPYECIYVYMQGNPGSISIWGDYLTTLDQGVDDRMSKKYRMIHSGFNYITGNSNASIFLKELINDYAD